MTLETWSKWREHAEREGMRFAAAPEYQVFPTEGQALKPYAAAVRASAVTRELIREVEPEVVVADILTVAASLAAELERRPWVTLVPHVLPMGEPGFPVYAVGAVYPRTALGRRLWRATRPLLMRGEQQGRDRAQRDAGARGPGPARARARRHVAPARAGGDPPPARVPAQRPRALAARDGPLMWEQPFGDVELPPGDEPLVLVAPSTSQDPEHRLLRATLEGLADEPVRVLATTNRRPPERPVDVPRNARLVDWVSYSRTMPACAAVVCHAGHGTVVRALASGAPVVACPHAGDMAENAARLRWAGLGVSLPRRFHTARGVRLAVRRLLADPRLRRAGRRRARLVRAPRRRRDRGERGRGVRYAAVTRGRVASPA